VYKRQDLDDMVGVFRRHNRLAAHWRELLAPRFTEIAYEGLVRAPESRIPELLAACEIPFDPAVLKPEALERPVFTASHAQVRQTIHTDAIERWRPHERHLRQFDPD